MLCNYRQNVVIETKVYIYVLLYFKLGLTRTIFASYSKTRGRTSFIEDHLLCISGACWRSTSSLESFMMIRTLCLEIRPQHFGISRKIVLITWTQKLFVVISPPPTWHSFQTFSRTSDSGRLHYLASPTLPYVGRFFFNLNELVV